MSFHTLRRTARLLAVVIVGLLVSSGLAAGNTVKWTFTVKPPGAGTVSWETDSPARDGEITKRGAVAFDKGGNLDVWFDSKPGYRLVSVDKNGQEFVFFLDIFNHFRFGPVEGSHNVTVTFVPILPSGTFDLSAPKDVPGVENMADLTGNYSGVSPTLHERQYDVDVAMDESGKLTGMGTIEGVEPTGGGDLEGSVGKVHTVGGEPVVDAKGKFNGTRDGVATSGKASLSGPAVPDGNTVSGSLTYKAKAGGVPVKDKNVPVQTTVDPDQADNVSTAWSIRLNVVEVNPTKKKTKKPYLVASAVLTLPNGDVIEFPEKKAKYSAKKGLKLKFRKGTNTTIQPNTVDKKTKIQITDMTLMEVGNDVWQPSGGSIKYQFLGQKGDADLIEFLDR